MIGNKQRPAILNEATVHTDIVTDREIQIPIAEAALKCCQYRPLSSLSMIAVNYWALRLPRGEVELFNLSSHHMPREINEVETLKTDTRAGFELPTMPKTSLGSGEVGERKQRSSTPLCQTSKLGLGKIQPGERISVLPFSTVEKFLRKLVARLRSL
ncbi:hypothetical protein VTL71DRAFT_2505 [Oculimacula yallundae]|uniref:Uncharacterized protein n=1 Tax=Oculimacula yallundae TaxID=86028 RepID=A0ABR4C983_9HELO